MINFTKDTYFEKPTQVAVMRVFDDGYDDTFIGVAYRDEVICLCCGTIFGVGELEEDNAIYKVLDWVKCDSYVAARTRPFDEAANSKS